MGKKKKKGLDGSAEVLRDAERLLAKEIYSLKNELSQNRKLEKPHLLRQKKRERARTLTKLTEVERGGAHGGRK
ncbi:MAG TPA: hypothetical protein VJK48_06260 [Chlamydiales bacterium]|nr:hypothetical protein [Chlamydiales bacterium]